MFLLCIRSLREWVDNNKSKMEVVIEIKYIFVDKYMKSIPVCMKAKPKILPKGMKQRKTACGHSTHYLDPHDQCYNCNPLKCDFLSNVCDLCECVQNWAKALLRKSFYLQYVKGKAIHRQPAQNRSKTQTSSGKGLL